MHDVFISYSSKEIEQAENLREILESNGIQCWMAPKNIPGGSNYTKEIPMAIKACKVFLLVFSKKAQCSQWVLKELDMAVNLGKRILPFMIEECETADEFKFLLSGYQHYAGYQDYVNEANKLIADICLITGKNINMDKIISCPKEKGDAAKTPIVPQRKERKAINAVCPACGSTQVRKRILMHSFFEKKEIQHYWVFVLDLVVAYIMGNGAKEVVNYPFVFGCFVFIIMYILTYPIFAIELWRDRTLRKQYPFPFECLNCDNVFLHQLEDDCPDDVGVKHKKNIT